MSSIRFGESYFATRERLLDVMRGIADLAAETQTDLGLQFPLQALEKGLCTPFLFVVSGEVNAGKSTLLNALFGEAVCPVNSLPETSQVLWYQHGTPPRNSEVTPLLHECYRPNEFLRDFTLIDTPGTNSSVSGHQEITARFLPTADLVFFVFPVTNPWEAATWNFISELSPDSLKRAVFIVQKADLQPADLDVILGHMRDLSVKRIGHVPPLFAVSGKTAWEAKRAQAPATALFRSSGYPELEAFISRKIHESPERRTALETAHRQAAAALRCVEDHIENQNREFNTQGRFLDTIEREIDEIRERFVNRLTRHLVGVAEIFESEALWGTKFLRRRLWLLPSLFRLFNGDRTGPQLEAVFIERLQAAVEAVAEKDGVEVVEVCRKHWNELGQRVQKSMGVDLGNAAPLDDTLALAKKHFIQRLGRAANQGIGNLKVRNQIDKDLRRRNHALKAFTVVTLVLITAAAICGALAVPWAPLILLGLALPFILGGSLVALITRRRITEEFQSRMLATCGSFANTLRVDYEEALRLVFQDYATSLSAVRNHLAREKSAIEPRLRRWHELFLTLKAIEQEL